MGFSEDAAVAALMQTGGNGDAAVELLLANPNPGPSPAPAPAPAPAPQAVPSRAPGGAAMSEEDQMAAAIAASLADAAPAAPAPRQQRTARSAASNKAAAAALARYGAGPTFGTGAQPATGAGRSAGEKAKRAGGSRSASRSPTRDPNEGGFTHKLRVPKKMEEHSIEHQLRRCATRVAKNPAALRMLTKAMKQLHAEPQNGRYRRINLRNRIFAQTIGAAPGGVDFFVAAGFQRVTEPGGVETLTLPGTADLARVWLAVSALEEAAASPAGRRALEEEALQKAIAEAQALAPGDDAEAVARASYVSRVPAEPSGFGNISVVRVRLGEDFVAERRFHGDDVLDNVIDFLGGYGSAIPQKLREGTWSLVDVTMFPKRRIECDAAEGRRTLQALELWPSASLDLELPAWTEEELP
mmetsp:Transcript_16249/g.49641  ORF Transcript_16249/g.49641 Transcript_16249/m.49641 type:complete len:413 (-) Transcript_16249:447-1685(-)